MPIIYPQDKWILSRIGKETDLEFEGTYFINYYLYDESMPRPHGALFTHIEPKHHQKFFEVAEKVDFAVCLNEDVAETLRGAGIEKVEVIYHGYQPELKKDITFGVCGRVYNDSGRKGDFLVKHMVDEGYDVIALGEGWSCKDQYPLERTESFYKEIDYLVIPSLIEGGPVPVLDALAAGVPVIAPDVGWCWEFPVIKYKRGDWESLNKVLNKLTNPPTWEKWRQKHKDLFHSYSKNL